MFNLWDWSFFSKCSKFYVDFENAIKIWENVLGFEDNCVWTCCENFCQLWWEHVIACQRVKTQS